MKEAFKKCMRHLYPEGVGPSQMADIIKVFVMGWTESRDAIGHDLLDSENTIAVEIAETAWRPDRSWQWW